MKKFLLIFFLTIPLVAFSQNATKWQVKQADNISSYVIKKLNLNSEDAVFFKKIQLERIVDNAAKVKETGASSPEDKQLIYRKSFNLMNELLTDKFGKQKAREILKAFLTCHLKSVLENSNNGKVKKNINKKFLNYFKK